MPTPPRRPVLLVKARVEAARVVALDAAGALDQIILRLPLQLTAGACRRAVVAGPADPPVDKHRELRRRARVVQGGAADATPAQLLVGVALVVVVVAGHRGAKALPADRQRGR